MKSREVFVRNRCSSPATGAGRFYAKEVASRVVRGILNYKHGLTMYMFVSRMTGSTHFGSG